MKRQAMSTSVRTLALLCTTTAIAIAAAAAAAAAAGAPDLRGSLEQEEPTGFFSADSLHAKYAGRATFDQYVTYAMRSISLVAGYDTDLHRYDSQQDLIDSFARNLTYGHDLSALRARIDSSERELLREASELTLLENERNQATCARHLDLLFDATVELNRDYRAYTQSRRLDLIDFLDSYGAAPQSQLMMGNTIWLGGYEQCQTARVDMPAREQAGGGGAGIAETTTIEGRYCVAHLRLPSWSRAPAPDKVSLGAESIKLGVCLPRACNSISILRHSARLEALIRLVRLHQVPYSRLALTQLFCLPDETSPLRQLSPSARAFVGLVACWLLLVAYHSLQYELELIRRAGGGHATRRLAPACSKLTQVFALRHAWRKLFELDEQPPAANYKRENLKQQISPMAASAGLGKQSVVHLKIHHQPDLDHNQNSRRSGHSDSGVPSPQSSSDGGSGGASSGSEAEHEQEREALQMRARFEAIKVVEQQLQLGRQRSRQTRQPSQPTPASAVQCTAATKHANGSTLTAIDGIKVISMVWLIAGHTMLFFIRNITNGRQFWAILLDGRFLTILAGIFPVDSFFTATGVLGSFLRFQRSRDSLGSPRYWLETFVHRYLRFMPMYLLVFWYTRDVSEYAGHGPMWDYATASGSLRAICKRESAWVPLLFQANFKPIEQHCVKPAWYLANDYQYLLLTPLYLGALLLSRWLGYALLSLSVLASLVLQFLTVYQPNLLTGGGGSGDETQAQSPEATFSDYETLANFRPMFATYVLKDLWRLYVLPYNRVPPYLIGLLTGHLMYRHHRRGQRAAEAASGRPTVLVAASSRSMESICSSDNSRATGGLGEEELQLHTTQPAVAVCAQSTELLTPPAADNKEQQTIAASRVFIARLARHLNTNVWTPVILLLAIIYLPMATKLLSPQEGNSAKVVASSLIALMRFVWSLSVARLIYLCYVTTTTPSQQQQQQQWSGSFIIGLLSSPKWKPFSKIGLSVLLIQWEIIGYVNQVQAGPPLMSITYLLAFVIICVVLSYALGLLVYLVFEFPMSQLEQLYIHPRLFGSKEKRKFSAAATTTNSTTSTKQ